MRSRTLGLAALFLLALPAAAAFEEMEMGIPAMAMGGTGVVFGGFQGALWNPASPATEGEASVTVSGKLPYTNLDFTTAGVDGGFALSPRWNLAGSARWFGGDLYSEQMLAVTVAGKLSRDFSLGLQPVVSRVAIEDGVSSYGSATAFSVNAGFRIDMYDRWVFAASVKNPFESRIGDSQEYMHRQMDAGVSYEPAEGFVTAFALSRDFRGTRVRVGGALPLGPVTMYAGAMSGPAALTGGFSAQVKGVGLSYAVVTHPELNLSHSFGVSHGF
ncbi:MAG TPA: hypothetical protein PLM22_08465 [Candidatus Sabulitectum sp.]|nr:hypothetical protein [Candidatus Sabulitectum sp.]HPF31773.1 hypothetical protein [Candidatus Sabulitectum sp.]HPJ28951.1 hypothetical protein [Candidatus Sabulitectum sp.]HPR22298.1 hypothetical protein [Candidatus Sabulitectum sp.]